MNLDQEMQAALETFVVESLELLQVMEDDLLCLEQQSDPSATVAAIFRAAHTIKGSAGLFGLEAIVQFTHVVESVLDNLRDGHLSVSKELIALLLPCCDHIGLLIHSLAKNQQAEDAAQTLQGDNLLKQLRPYLGQEHVVSAPPVAATGDTTNSPLQTGNWHISLRFGEDSLRNGMDPFAFISYLGSLGTIVAITTLTDALPEATQMDPESCYLGFEIALQSDAGKEALEGVFEFVREDSLIHILPPNSCIEDYIELIHALPEGEQRLGEILINSGVLTRRELEEGLQQQYDQMHSPADPNASSPPLTQTKPIGAILVETQSVPQPLVNAALEKQQHARDAKKQEHQSIRVDAEKLDKLIDLVGELVISCAAASLRAVQLKDAHLLEANAQMTGLVEAVRDSTLKLRMIPICATFNRFQRVVRDVSTELGKDIGLVISGGDTEVDKSVIEHIGDPLMHLVRNAMDHGIESAALRLARGKPAKGLIKLNAYHESGTIVIEVGDDGGGLDRERILAKAIERDLVSAGASLSDKEIHALIFEPGFSTAEQVSNLSGRGVGMDVVKQNITALRGVIDIDSIPGEGTTLKIRLPLTLAIIDGFLVGVGEAFFVVPQDRIVECVELPSQNKQYGYMDLRGEVLPFIRLGSLFNIPREAAKRENVVVVDCAGNKTGLVVDRLIGEFQTVIKPLGTLFNHVQGIGGSTILGSGEVALIIDVPTLVGYYSQRAHVTPRAA
jgi:two-component system chemotaxis sensor kinase CheA